MNLESLVAKRQDKTASMIEQGSGKSSVMNTENQQKARAKKKKGQNKPKVQRHKNKKTSYAFINSCDAFKMMT